MGFESVKAWLEREAARQVRSCQWQGILGLALTPVAVGFGGFLLFWAVWLMAYKTEGEPDIRKCLWITGAIVLALFVLNRFLPDSEKDAMLEDDRDGTLVGEWGYRHRLKWGIFLWILFTGPRVFDWALGSFREASRWKRMDTHSCAAVLWLLLIKLKRVPYEQIPVELDWLDLEAVLPQLAQIPGVLRVRVSPAGLSLSDDLREAIRTGGPLP